MVSIGSMSKDRYRDHHQLGPETRLRKKRKNNEDLHQSRRCIDHVPRGVFALEYEEIPLADELE